MSALAPFFAQRKKNRSRDAHRSPFRRNKEEGGDHEKVERGKPIPSSRA